MKAVIITPAYTHTHEDLTPLVLATRIQWIRLHGHSDLPRARSALIERALATDAQRIIFLDADTIPAAGVLETLATAADVTPGLALWGLYPLREGDRWAVNPEDATEGDAAIRRGGQFRIRTGGLGICCIHRESLERVAAKLPLITEDTGTQWHPFCLPVVCVENDSATYYADDGSLCVRLRESGTELRCDPKLRAAHAVTTLIKDIHGGNTTAR